MIFFLIRNYSTESENETESEPELEKELDLEAENNTEENLLRMKYRNANEFCLKLSDCNSAIRPDCEAILNSKKYKEWILKEEELFKFYRNDIKKLEYLWKTRNDIEKSFMHLIIRNILNKRLEEEVISFH